MTEPRDDRYRRRFLAERERADHYRDLAIGLAAVCGNGIDLREWFDAEDAEQVIALRRQVHTGRR